MKNLTDIYSNPKQAVLPLLIQDYLDICNPVLTFDRFMGEIELEKYLKKIPEHCTGRIRYNSVSMLKKYMKFPMFKKETTDKNYHEDPFRAVNFGIMKNDRWYKRIVRRGLQSVLLEVYLVSIGQNLYKFHNKRMKIKTAA